MPIQMTYKFKNNNIVQDGSWKKNEQFDDTLTCDVYSFGLVDQFGAMALCYTKDSKEVKYIENIYGSNGQIAKQIVKTEMLSGWFTTMNKNLKP